MTLEEWLAGLKVGDEVMIWGNRRSVLTVVERATKLHVTAAGRKFRRKNGSEVTDGDIWQARWIERPFPQPLV